MITGYEKLAVCFLVLFSFSCSHQSKKTEGSYGLTQESIEEDSSYKEILDQYKKEARVYENFETKILLSAVYMSPNFQKAFQIRFKQLLEQNFEAFQINEKELVFFVSLYTPFKEAFDLKDSSLWHVKARQANGQNLLPQSIQLISHKQRWSPYFDFISTWSKEYLISFPKPKSEKEETLSLILSSSLGKIHLNWE